PPPAARPRAEAVARRAVPGHRRRRRRAVAAAAAHGPGRGRGRAPARPLLALAAHVVPADADAPALAAVRAPAAAAGAAVVGAVGRCEVCAPPAPQHPGAVARRLCGPRQQRAPGAAIAAAATAGHGDARRPRHAGGPVQPRLHGARARLPLRPGHARGPGPAHRRAARVARPAARVRPGRHRQGRAGPAALRPPAAAAAL
ncbi:hypothetical protein H4R18_004306, partial [Coemansia javaensis]